MQKAASVVAVERASGLAQERRVDQMRHAGGRGQGYNQGWLWVGKRTGACAGGGGASQAMDVGGQKRRQAAAEAVVKVSGGRDDRV